MVAEVLTKYGERIVAQLKNDIKNKPLPRRGGKSFVADASGDLEKSVNYKLVNGGKTLQIWANGYIYYLMFGRKPGKRPPREVIVKWIQDKGIQSDIPVNSLAFLIQRAIGKEGTTLYPTGSTLLSDIMNEELINDLKSDLFIQIVDEAVTSFRQLSKAA